MVTFQTVINNLATIRSRVNAIASYLADENLPPGQKMDKIREVMDKGESPWSPQPMLDLVTQAQSRLNEENARVSSGMSFVAAMLGQNSEFVAKVSEEVASNISASDVAEEISVSDVAEQISLRELSDYISVSEVAECIDVEDVASHVEIDSEALARKISRDHENEIIVHIVDDMWEHFGNRLRGEGAETLVDELCAAIAKRLSAGRVE